MTNEQSIKNASRKHLAELLIQRHIEPDYDYDYEDNLYVCNENMWYKTSDGTDFCDDYESALQHECWWLAQEVKAIIDVHE